MSTARFDRMLLEVCIAGILSELERAQSVGPNFLSLPGLPTILS